MNIEQAYKIRKIANDRSELAVMINNILENKLIALEYGKPLGCGDGIVYIHNGEPLFNLIVDHYKKELAKIDEELENL